ncbi:MAG TPA: hypothetical protein VKA41_03410 [Solirubrobacterales bacterium]|nr:hypothetical protein [Solirubrobacterales bacterium]
MARKAVGKLLIAAVLAGLVLLGPGVADAGVAVKNGLYKGKTTQQAVTDAFRKIQFKVKKGKIILTTEPSVARESCVSTSVFTMDGKPSRKLGRNGTFTFTRPFFGKKVDKIQGRFVSPNEIEGFAIYHFFAQDLCSGGRARVNFTAKHK